MENQQPMKISSGGDRPDSWYQKKEGAHLVNLYLEKNGIKMTDDDIANVIMNKHAVTKAEADIRAKHLKGLYAQTMPVSKALNQGPDRIVDLHMHKLLQMKKSGVKYGVEEFTDEIRKSYDGMNDVLDDHNKQSQYVKEMKKRLLLGEEGELKTAITNTRNHFHKSDFQTQLNFINSVD